MNSETGTLASHVRQDARFARKCNTLYIHICIDSSKMDMRATPHNMAD